MKLIVAVIKPFKLDEVQDALIAAGINGVTVTDARGFGRQRGHTEVYRGAEYKINFVPKVRVEILASDQDAPRVVDTLIDTARTGKIGDGKVWILPVDSAYRIRTGEAGEDAL